MNTKWLHKANSDELILFFSGWGMIDEVITHLTGAYDVLVCYDYSQIANCSFPELMQYKKIHLVAWSMGVWAASQYIFPSTIHFANRIAVNGTAYPIHAQWGIPPRVYQLTERSMSVSTRKNFMGRMYVAPPDEIKVERLICQRTLEDVANELTAIRLQASSLDRDFHWDSAFIGTQDQIFPSTNQIAWCKEKGIDYALITAGHDLFIEMNSWDEILKEKVL